MQYVARVGGGVSCGRADGSGVVVQREQQPPVHGRQFCGGRRGWYAEDRVQVWIIPGHGR